MMKCSRLITIAWLAALGCSSASSQVPGVDSPPFVDEASADADLIKTRAAVIAALQSRRGDEFAEYLSSDVRSDAGKDAPLLVEGLFHTFGDKTVAEHIL